MFQHTGPADEIQIFSDKEFKDLLKSGSYKCYWNRIFLTGPFGVGKTALAKILVGEDVPEQRESTDGIWIYIGKAGMDIQERSWIFLKKGISYSYKRGLVIGKLNGTKSCVLREL